MRTTEAAQCNVRSVLLLPLFGDPERSSTIGVVEVAQSTDKMPFGNVVTALSAAFKVRFAPSPAHGLASATPGDRSCGPEHSTAFHVGSIANLATCSMAGQGQTWTVRRLFSTKLPEGKLCLTHIHKCQEQ